MTFAVKNLKDQDHVLNANKSSPAYIPLAVTKIMVPRLNSYLSQIFVVEGCAAPLTRMMILMIMIVVLITNIAVHQQVVVVTDHAVPPVVETIVVV